MPVLQQRSRSISERKRHSGTNVEQNAVLGKRKSLETLRVMFVGTQVDTISCKGADSVCCPLSCAFSLFLLCGKLEYLTQGRRNARLDLALLHRAVHRADVAVDDADALVGAAGLSMGRTVCGSGIFSRTRSGPEPGNRTGNRGIGGGSPVGQWSVVGSVGGRFAGRMFPGRGEWPFLRSPKYLRWISCTVRNNPVYLQVRTEEANR